MSSLVLNSNQWAQLNGLKNPVEVHDDSGKPVGVLLSREEYDKLIYKNLVIPFTPEELDEAFKNKEGACTLQEFWQRMGQK